jgi:hypothetical protein
MKQAFLVACAAFALTQIAAAAGVDSLSRLFLPGHAVLDLDGDGFPDKPVLAIIVPDKPTAGELALAGDIAARANFESLAVEFGLVRRESEAAANPLPALPILIGNVGWTREALKAKGLEAASLAPNQGRVFLVGRRSVTGIACVAGSDETLLKTGRAFFLRWPYFWEIWGRETGATYENLEKDLAGFLASAGIRPQTLVVKEASYEFAATPPAADGLRALSFDQGQIRELVCEVRVGAEADREKASAALSGLAAEQRRGGRTSLLSYPACAALTIEIVSGAGRSKVTLPRTGATKRLLTPAFKERPAEAAAKDFDLLGVFSTKGAYADSDHDGIPDTLDTVVVVPAGSASLGLADLPSRLVLGAAGASFPIVQIDAEVESRKALAAPILVGSNALTADLVKTGKLKIPELEPGAGLLKIVPKAFGKSAVLVVDGADGTGLERTLAYLSRTFPFLADYGEGRPQLSDLAAGVDRFLAGEEGAAEAFFMNAIDKAAAELKGRDLESVSADLVLPKANAPFQDALRTALRAAAGDAPVSVSITSLSSGRAVLEKEKTLAWEVDDAKALLQDRLRALIDAAGKGGAVEVSLGVSESPAVRAKVREEIQAFLGASGFPSARVDVACAYKPGFFWLVENVLPALKGRPVDRVVIRFAEERPDFSRPQRTYSEPSRWLQELYPVDEIAARELALPLDRIVFEMIKPGGPTYAVQALDAQGEALFEANFTPRTRAVPLSGVLPEWGEASVTTGWLRIVAGGTIVCDRTVETDLERFWGFYQNDVLPAVAAHVRKKTGGEPTFSKQPYFKRLLVDLQASEPDYRIGLDEEIISSLEAIHDEIYFDTLDLMRGLTRFDPEDKDVSPDTSRSSAPGNVFPSLHPSLEGGPAKVRVVLEDWPAAAPELVLRAKEKGREEIVRKTVLPALKPKETRVSELVFDGRSGRVANVVFESEWEKEADFLAAIDMAEAWRRLREAGLIPDAFRYPGLESVTLRLCYQAQGRDERLAVGTPAGAADPVSTPGAASPAGGAIVPTREIISPEMASDLVRRLAGFDGVRGYVGGRTFEGRDVPVLELFLPAAKYVSLPRLTTLKPTLQVIARQHANEVSSTSYLLEFAEILARDPAAREALRTTSFVFEPMENPDGAALAYAMHKNEPFHSLHAGRYGALGVDMGYQTGSKPLLPEASVRAKLYERWAPDIVLNLHGYPSHEWVQPFSNYTPYLFRDYWIPKGWFCYFRSLSLPIYEEHRAAGEALRGMIAAELTADPAMAAQNQRFIDRFERWAARWAPHMNALEIENGLAIFSKRRGPTESRMTPRTQTTFSEQTPELMDETATGGWLEALCAQGLAYLRAHTKYLSQAKFPVVRIEEEVRGRARITLVRGRPGKAGTSDKSEAQ